LLEKAMMQVHCSDLSGRFVFYGARKHRFVLDLMAKCDCLVAPSVTAADGDAEGIPVTLMEAMAMGLPVISTEHAGIPELLTNGVHGRLVPEGDPLALARAIEAERAAPWAFVRAAQARVRTEFCMETRYRALFERVARVVAEGKQS
jgi:colanic acid/amylovoran biosynthesis glycosyltransferase